MNKERLLTLTLIILAAAASRLLPHPQNMAPIAALALFGAAKFERKSLAFVIPGIALLASDAVIGFYSGMWVTYLAFALVTCIGFTLRGKESFARNTATVLGSSVLFFLITNNNFLSNHEMYPATFDGMMAAYIAGIPFFQNTLIGDLLYSALLFGGFALAERRFSFLRAPQLSAA